MAPELEDEELLELDELELLDDELLDDELVDDEFVDEELLDDDELLDEELPVDWSLPPHALSKKATRSSGVETKVCCNGFLYIFMPIWMLSVFLAEEFSCSHNFTVSSDVHHKTMLFVTEQSTVAKSVEVRQSHRFVIRCHEFPVWRELAIER